jgi:hypothetical protein
MFCPPAVDFSKDRAGEGCSHLADYTSGFVGQGGAPLAVCKSDPDGDCRMQVFDPVDARCLKATRGIKDKTNETANTKLQRGRSEQITECWLKCTTLC